MNGRPVSRAIPIFGGRRNKLVYRWVAERGSGSRGTLYVGNRFTVVKDLKKEIGAGLLSDMLKQLAVRREDL
jgi:hypothetical protein